ncbi:MAG: Asp-tRNA(Asn)/Glu-tRNA(Gln) amidotransferase subunit GatC [Clostridia bacterium]|nr:Asp-tRNA(Asn)/Glu-tRNA(Gln) amidotransferase subunit GatC [Clostridia bacterium]
MSITIKEIEHLAKLARLNLSDEEKERLTGEMSGILDFAHKLNELDVSDISPTMHVGADSNVFREDVARESYPTSEILRNAAEADEGCFLVPKTVE